MFQKIVNYFTLTSIVLFKHMKAYELKMLGYVSAIAENTMSRQFLSTFVY